MPNTKKKGGSQSSQEVVSFVNPSAFDKLNQMFTNKVSFGGGNCRKHLVDINESTDQKMMVYNKSGGKKKVAKKPKAKKGGSCPASSSASVTDYITGAFDQMSTAFKRVDNPLPPASTPSASRSSLNMSIIPESQKMLTTEPVNTMGTMQKWTQYPQTTEYKGAFAFGGAKKKTKTTKPKKAAPKPKKVAPKKPKTGKKKT
jgi:hypothetical protein